MIKEIRVENFLSYGKERVELGGSTVAVTGENGSGKSSLLETVPYAYFGLGRESLAGMSRINGDGTHEVVILDDNGVEVKRGRKSSGNGYFEVRKGGELVAKGKEASEWIENYLGMDADTFMLTAFFGLHDVRHDPLIRVTPATRLEALQKLADVGPYRDFLKRAKTQLKATEDDLLEARSRKDGAESAMADETELEKRRDDAEDSLTSASKRLLDLKEQRAKLRVEEEKYQAFVSEKERISVERRNLDKEITRLDDDVALMTETVENIKEQIDRDIKAKQECVADEITKLDLDHEREVFDAFAAEAVQSERMIELKSTAVTAGAVSRCPLCNSKIDEATVDRWKEDIEELKGSVKEAKENKNASLNAIRRYEDITTEIDILEKRIKSSSDEGTATERKIANTNHELKKLRAEKSKKDDRFIDIQEKLGEEYQGLQREIDNVDEWIDEVKEEIHESRAEIKAVEVALKANTNARRIVSNAEKEIKKLKVDQAAYSLLTKAWNRYGIPMSLIKRTMEAIEQRSTLVYQEFDSGKVVVREVEDRGKPGVDFLLSDRKGERSFAQLSAGEKVMFFVAIRVAIAQIVSESRPVSVDYLILDEAMGNLSPKRRDDLVRLINKVLRKLFPQVLMVSHTEMREIFTQTLRVTAGDGVSNVEVVT